MAVDCGIYKNQYILFTKRRVLNAKPDGKFTNHYALWGGGDRSGTVVKALCYKSEGRWFDPSWCHWNFSLT